MRLPIASFYPAAPTNQTAGRGGNPIDRITIHHTAALNTTLRYLWADPARNGSSHFFVSDSVIEQYVDTDNTAWTNGNFASNQRSISIEVNGDWRNGYYNQATLNNLQRLLVELRRNFPTTRLTYHVDESLTTTLCPADLKHKGYALTVWNNAWAILNPPPPPSSPPPAVMITYQTIPKKQIQLIRDANLWNFNFTSWSTAKAVGSYPTGYVVSNVVAIATNSLGGKYYMTEYSYNNGAIRATNGFNVKDVKDYTLPPVPVPPTEPTPPPVVVPVPVPPPVPPVPPLDDETVGLLKSILLKLGDIIKSITDFLTKRGK
jgi:N-acetylmuramoyl-L-alanine amidase